MANPFSPTQGKFSLIVPVYKTAKCLNLNLLHLNDQDYKNFEVIIVFDGKDTRGTKLVEELIKKYPDLDIKYDTIKHGGAPKARNHGVTLATGVFYSFLDADSYLYPGTLRRWANLFEENPHINRIWGLYDVNRNGRPLSLGGGIATDLSDRPIYWAFRFANYCSGTFPVRKEAFVGWTEGLKSLQDWDLNLRMLKKDNFEGKDWLFVREKFFITELTRKSGISTDAFKHWLEREKVVLQRNDIPVSDTCVCSVATQMHGIKYARICGYDYIHTPQYMPFEYKRLIQHGFFTAPTEMAMASYGLFQNCTTPENQGKDTGRFPGKKIIMWAGSDIHQMRNNAGFETLKLRRETWKSEGWINIVGDKNAHDKLKEIGFDSRIVYYPATIYKPMPLPKEFAFGIYENQYGGGQLNDNIYELAKKYPKIKFYFYGDESRKGLKEGNIEHLGWINMDEWMPKFSAKIELTLTGGIGSGGVEFLTAGRQLITDVDEPYTFKAENTLESIEKAYLEMMKKPFDVEKASAFYAKRHDPKKFKKIMDSL